MPYQTHLPTEYCALVDPSGQWGLWTQTSNKFLFCKKENRFQDKLADSSGCDNAKRCSASGAKTPNPNGGSALHPDPCYIGYIGLHSTLAMWPAPNSGTVALCLHNSIQVMSCYVYRVFKQLTANKWCQWYWVSNNRWYQPHLHQTLLQSHEHLASIHSQDHERTSNSDRDGLCQNLAVEHSWLHFLNPFLTLGKGFYWHMDPSLSKYNTTNKWRRLITQHTSDN